MILGDELWDEFANYENFLLAWQRTVNVTSRMVHEKLGMKIFAYNLHSNLEDLVQQVTSEDFPYSPLADHKVYVPKPSTTLRTMSLMAVPDVIVYQALVNVIADHSHLHLASHENEHVLGNLYAGAGRRWMLQPWKRQYSRFVKRVEKFYNSGNSWIASTDIVAFYDTIDHERLLSLIRQYCGKNDRFECLFRECLSKWSAHNATSTMGRGIPQGSNASDFLSNLYLHEIDCKLISSGYHYIRYVDDVRILGLDKSTVQRGLILFDLELKCAGLVAQVSKTSVHEIDDIEKEVSQLKFVITDPTGTGEYILLETPFPPANEQAGSVESLIENTQSEQTELEQNESHKNCIDEDEDYTPEQNINIDKHKSEKLQRQLRDKFLEAFDLLNDLDRAKEAESHITFCLYRLEPHMTLRSKGISLLSRLPWRSEAISAFLGRFENDSSVIEELNKFISEHKVYSWHRANTLWALYKISTANDVANHCREWLVDNQLDWYAKTIAARILAEVPSQHSFLIECLKKEQKITTNEDAEATSVFRQELAHSAFQRIKSFKKQLILLQLACADQSPILHRLAIYLLQQPKCKVNLNDIKPYPDKLGALSGLIEKLGMTDDISKPCFVAETIARTYKISLSKTDLRSFYANHYDKAIETLRESVIAFQKSPSLYVSHFHQFTHITFIAFYEYALPSESGIYESNYASLFERKIFQETLPYGVNSWKTLNSMRNRAEHPVDRKNKSHSRKITIKEVELLHIQIQVALQEMFDFWLGVDIPEDETVTLGVPEMSVEATTETIEASVPTIFKCGEI